LAEVAIGGDALPAKSDFDATHRNWRASMVREAEEIGLMRFSHGIAAKLINVYLKGMIICGGHHQHPRAAFLHPPIDSLLLDELYAENIGGQRAAWSDARRLKWSKLTSEQYESVVVAVRNACGDHPLWRIEAFWRGHQ
jgi:hypothetical protein